jgi:hypothetical protein
MKSNADLGINDGVFISNVAEITEEEEGSHQEEKHNAQTETAAEAFFTS